MKIKFILESLGCANCAAKMERLIGKLDGVISINVNFMTTKLIMEVEEEKISVIIPATEKIIKKIEPDVILKKI